MESATVAKKRMTTKSAKAKGRRLAQSVKVLLLGWAPDLKENDISVTPSGINGPDLWLSPAAESVYPLAIECKNRECINIWEAMKQAEKNAAAHLKPIVFFSRNREEVYVAMKAEDFLRLVR